MQAWEARFFGGERKERRKEEMTDGQRARAQYVADQSREELTKDLKTISESLERLAALIGTKSISHETRKHLFAEGCGLAETLFLCWKCERGRFLKALDEPKAEKEAGETVCPF